MAPQILPDMSDRFKRRLNFLRRAVGPSAGGYRAATLLALAREGHGAAVIPMTAARAVGQKTLVANAATQSDCEAAFNSRTRRGAKRAPASASTSPASGRGNWSNALLILPDGQISKGRCLSRVQSLSQKYSGFPKTKSVLYPPPSRLPRGAFRDRHKREAGCGGR